MYTVMITRWPPGWPRTVFVKSRPARRFSRFCGLYVFAAAPHEPSPAPLALPPLALISLNYPAEYGTINRPLDHLRPVQRGDRMGRRREPLGDAGELHARGVREAHPRPTSREAFLQAL